MKTSAQPHYSEYAMKSSYVALAKGEISGLGEPLDFAPLDAPPCIAAGSHQCYEFTTLPGKFVSLYTVTSRET